jgi:hypothetical protein
VGALAEAYPCVLEEKGTTDTFYFLPKSHTCCTSKRPFPGSLHKSRLYFGPQVVGKWQTAAVPVPLGTQGVCPGYTGQQDTRTSGFHGIAGQTVPPRRVGTRSASRLVPGQRPDQSLPQAAVGYKLKAGCRHMTATGLYLVPAPGLAGAEAPYSVPLCTPMYRNVPLMLLRLSSLRAIYQGHQYIGVQRGTPPLKHLLHVPGGVKTPFLSVCECVNSWSCSMQAKTNVSM